MHKQGSEFSTRPAYWWMVQKSTVMTVFVRVFVEAIWKKKRRLKMAAARSIQISL